MDRTGFASPVFIPASLVSSTAVLFGGLFCSPACGFGSMSVKKPFLALAEGKGKTQISLDQSNTHNHSQEFNPLRNRALCYKGRKVVELLHASSGSLLNSQTISPRCL